MVLINLSLTEAPAGWVCAGGGAGAEAEAAGGRAAREEPGGLRASKGRGKAAGRAQRATVCTCGWMMALGPTVSLDEASNRRLDKVGGLSIPKGRLRVDPPLLSTLSPAAVFYHSLCLLSPVGPIRASAAASCHNTADALSGMHKHPSRPPLVDLSPVSLRRETRQPPPRQMRCVVLSCR